MTLRVDWLADWQTTSKWETGWLKNWFTDWLTVSLTERLKDWLTDWLTGWESQTNRQTDWLIDWQACTQTLFYFSLRSFRKHRRAREKEKIKNVYFLLPHPYPLALVVNKSPPVFIFYHPRSTDFEKKGGSVNRLLTDWLADWETCRLTSWLNDYPVWFSIRRENYPVWRERSFKLKKKGQPN